MKPASASRALSDFLTRYRPALVILTGEARGLEYRLDQPRTALGRGPGVDLALDDESLRTRHALVEFKSGGVWVRQADGARSGRPAQGGATRPPGPPPAPLPRE